MFRWQVGVLGSHVHSIVMSSNNMVGSLPASIAALSHLRMIELATMPGLGGVLNKQFCELVNLRRLCICRCGIRGSIPDEIGDLVQLEELQLFGNMMTGSIPDSVRNLVNLRLLSLGEYTGGNNFAPAGLPPCISALQSLEALFIANCNLTGAIPDWIGGLTELRQLDLQRNNLTGTLPASLGHLGSLLYLNVKDNVDLSGELPVEVLSKLTKLNRLSLVHCSFTNAGPSVAHLQTLLPRCRIWI
jgi:Leucine-rich repeat (LRR) protein